MKQTGFGVQIAVSLAPVYDPLPEALNYLAEQPLLE